MAIVMTGGMMGFGAALLAFFALDMGVLTALGLWVGSGPLSATLALGLAARRPVDDPDDALDDALPG
jgi:hypothetical protein